MPVIRKGSFSLSLTYSDGNFTNNLIGANAAYDTRVNTFEFTFDLKKKFRSKNKHGNDYLDINGLNEQRDKLRAVQIFDSSLPYLKYSLTLAVWWFSLPWSQPSWNCSGCSYGPCFRAHRPRCWNALPSVSARV